MNHIYSKFIISNMPFQVLTMIFSFRHLLMSPKNAIIMKSYSIETHQNHLHIWESFTTIWLSPTNPFTQASLPSQGWVMLHTHFTHTNNKNIARFKERNHIKLLHSTTPTTRFFTETTATPYQIYNTMKKHHGSWIPILIQAKENEKLL